MLNEPLKLKGTLRIVRTNASGKVTLDKEFDNLIVQVGKNLVAAALIAGQTPFGYMAVGTGTTPAVLADTTLQTEVARVAFSAASTTLNVATMVATFGAGVGTATLTEAGILNANAAGVLLSRVLFAAINKGPTDALQITWTVTAG